MLRDYAEGYAQTMEVNTDCQCEIFDDEGQVIPTTDCFGCYTDAKEDLLSELDYWLGRAGDPEYVRIEGRGMGWMSRDGYAIVEAKPDELFEAMTINGEFRLVFEWDERDILTARRYSHDEPTGTGLFTFEPMTQAQYDDDGLAHTD